ncbi:hypothetical protein CGS46_10105 [Faecalibacterium langellae]|uniref:ParB/Sulfiredoxin domain-containing protein n=1 Tax=Faecalibacterium langellae TaxID=3435293 RepID=A0A2A6Z9E8_9FIRM|nr:hypothetical protein [Faecalibacterium prausnitzii]PDX57986.1 hypothetical protein CGS46_10105 [Faecalibacterium prausnitzii]
MKKNKFEFIIDSEFQSQIPALTDEEFQQLEENILSEGEVLSPLIVWGNILVDGHNRYKILQQHPEIPYTTRSISCTCETREDVLAWICKHQLGRRNLTPEQKKFLIGKQYHSEKSTRGGNHGNQYTQVANCQIDNLPPVENTMERIAKENNVSPSFVIRAEQFMKTVELMEKYCPGIQEEILSGKLKLSQREATIIRGTPTEALPTVVSTWREEKLNGKPDDSADTYENLELLSKVTENNFSTAAASKMETQLAEIQGQIDDIHQEKITADNIYHLLLAFDEVYNAATEVEQKEFMRAFIERIDIFPEKQPNGNWIRNIVFAFPVPYNGKEIREFPLESQSTVEAIVSLQREI